MIKIHNYHPFLQPRGSILLLQLQKENKPRTFLILRQEFQNIQGKILFNLKYHFLDECFHISKVTKFVKKNSEILQHIKIS